jgi:hypothetical protein
MTNVVLSEEDFFKKLSERVSTPTEELKTEFEQVLKEVEADSKFTNYNADQKRNIARNKFGLRKTKELSSNAIPWEGIIIGVGDLIDTVAKAKKATDAAFKADPLKAMQGWVYNEVLVKADKDGKAVWPETDNNKKFGRVGKPLPEHSWLRSLYLIARPIDPKTKQPGPTQVSIMSVNNAPAIDMTKTPLNVPVKFKGINKTNDEDRKIGVYRINHSAFTKFEPITSKDFPPLETLLPAMDQYQSLGTLDTYHNENEKNPTRWIVTEGSVAMLNLEPNVKTGNMFMILSDESLIFGGSDKTGVMCWIPSDRNIKMDFGVESRVFVIGKTNRGNAKDPITGEIQKGVPGDVSLNVYNIYAPEMFKTMPEVIPLTAQAVTPSNKEW